ncbi:MAG: hypothetical protein QOI12_2800 [Alphaproteobacteria bacterium]|jgi:hypothetical protein|nr:hypothetical protein [Alphaproteobacteria bacterium]
MAEIKTDKHDAIILSSQSEKDVARAFVELFKAAPLPDDEILPNLGLFLTSKALSRVLFFHEIYKKILNTHGVIMEFGVRWGQSLSVLSALRGIFEPFNRHRKIVGFDTFAGFKGMSEKDGTFCNSVDGSFSVSENYEQYLDRLLALQEALNPIPHLKKYELVRGDAADTIPAYLKQHPETLISLAILDFDIYEPTKAALAAIKPHLFKGSVLVFDELCDPYFPGETIALREVFGLSDLKIERLPMTARISYTVL